MNRGLDSVSHFFLSRSARSGGLETQPVKVVIGVVGAGQLPSAFLTANLAFVLQNGSTRPTILNADRGVLSFVYFERGREAEQRFRTRCFTWEAFERERGLVLINLPRRRSVPLGRVLNFLFICVPRQSRTPGTDELLRQVAQDNPRVPVGLLLEGEKEKGQPEATEATSSGDAAPHDVWGILQTDDEILERAMAGRLLDFSPALHPCAATFGKIGLRLKSFLGFGNP